MYVECFNIIAFVIPNAMNKIKLWILFISEERESWKYLVNDVQIDFSKPLGTGKFGNVFQGNYKGSKVLIKVPLNHDVLAFRNTFLNEAKMLRFVKLSNLLSIILLTNF